MTTAAKKIKTTASVFELPQRLGVLQYVEYEPPPREWCTEDGCLYEGILTAEGCRRGCACGIGCGFIHGIGGSGRWGSGGGEGWMKRLVAVLGNRWLMLCGS
jgi:hypothetical protein